MIELLTLQFNSRLNQKIIAIIITLILPIKKSLLNRLYAEILKTTLNQKLSLRSEYYRYAAIIKSILKVELSGIETSTRL